MSTTAVSPNITHLPHTAHPIPLREQAFTLHCEGLRSPAIAAELGVSERTIRAWIAAALDDLKDDLQLNRKEQLLLAVERQHQLTAIAWQQFEAEAAARNTLLDVAMEALRAVANSPTESASRPVTVRLTLPASTPAPRYLSLILQANKEANRLLGLHTLANLQLLTPETGPASAPVPTPLTASVIPAKTATVTPESQNPAESATASAPLNTSIVGAPGWPPSADDCEIPAKTATDSESAQADFVAAGPPGAVSTAGPPPAESATSPSPIPSCPPFSSVSQAPPTAGVWGTPTEGGRRRADSVLNLRPPAKTATAIKGVSARPQPATPHSPTLPALPRSHSPTRPHPWMM